MLDVLWDRGHFVTALSECACWALALHDIWEKIDESSKKTESDQLSNSDYSISGFYFFFLCVCGQGWLQSISSNKRTQDALFMAKYKTEVQA